MRTSAVFRSTAIALVLWLAFYSVSAHAAINNAGILDSVLTRYQAAASTWQAVITARATWLFWVLATISMVWTFGMMALRKADIGEFFAEFVRFTIFTGFFWWLLSNGPNFATDIMNSLRTLAANASGNPSTLTPSGIVDIGFDIFFKVLDQSSVWSPVDSAAGILISAVILVVLALVAVNMLVLLVSGWLLAYAGIFFLGFGGARWTSEMAIGYFKTVLSIAAQLFTMVLLVGIGKSFVDTYYAAMSAGISFKELGVMLIVAIVLLTLVNKVPPLIGGLAGAHTHALGNGFGAGTAISAAAMGAAAAASAGAALVTGGASMAGGAQALMAAFAKASAAQSEGEGGSAGMGNFMAAAGRAGSSDSSASGGPLAAAMGDSVSTGRSIPTSPSARSESRSTTTGAASSGAGAGSDAKGKSKTQDTADKGDAPGEGKSGSKLAAAGAMAAKVGKVAAGTAGNLAQGSWDVAKTKASAMKEAAMDRISETTGGKIATAIHARAEAEAEAASKASFDGNSLSAETEEKVDAESEVAAFRDRDTPEKKEA
jgi:type IV secretion system protein TrbL